MKTKKNVLLDMETGDPDDLMTLCLLANHSQLNLRAVTVTPGTDEQIGLVRKVLGIVGKNVPVGSYRPNYDKRCVGKFYYKWFGKIEPKQPDDEGWKIIQETIAIYPDLIILTGAPLKNFGAIADTMEVNQWVGQGGFAGDNVVPPELRLPKFEGKITCPTFNFNGDPQTALTLLDNSKVKQKHLVAKNVCHGVIYDQAIHEQFHPFRYQSAGLYLTYKGMSIYLKKKPAGKKFHDPLALAVVINPSVCTFREVELYREKGGWGSRLKAGSNTFISIQADVTKMIQALTDQ